MLAGLAMLAYNTVKSSSEVKHIEISQQLLLLSLYIYAIKAVIDFEPMCVFLLVA